MVDVVLSWPAWARAQRGLGASARACLRELASLADDRGAAIVEISWLAEATDRCHRTVWRGLAELEDRALIVRTRDRMQSLGVVVDVFTGGAVDPDDNEGLRAVLVEACHAGWVGRGASRLAVTLLEHGPKQFGRLAVRQARFEGETVSNALADVLTLAWLEARASAASMIRARRPWAVWSRAVECAVAEESLASLEDRNAVTIEGVVPEGGSSLAGEAGELYVGIDELTGPFVRVIDVLREAGMPSTLAWAGSVRIAQIAAHVSVANAHTMAARDATLASLGVSPTAARAWMTLLVGSRRGTVLNALDADQKSLAEQAAVVAAAWRKTLLIA